MKSLQEACLSAMAKKGMNREILRKGAHISTALLLSVKNGTFPNLVESISSERKKHALAKSINRMALFLEEDPLQWLQLAGFLDAQELLRFLSKDALLKRINDDSVYPEVYLNVDDIKFLLSVVEGLKQPVTLKSLLELLKLRQPVSK